MVQLVIPQLQRCHSARHHAPLARAARFLQFLAGTVRSNPDSCYRDVDYRSEGNRNAAVFPTTGLVSREDHLAQGLLPTRARIHRQRANLLLALAQVSARERGRWCQGRARDSAGNAWRRRSGPQPRPAGLSARRLIVGPAAQHHPGYLRPLIRLIHHSIPGPGGIGCPIGSTMSGGRRGGSCGFGCDFSGSLMGMASHCAGRSKHIGTIPQRCYTQIQQILLTQIQFNIFG